MMSFTSRALYAYPIACQNVLRKRFGADAGPEGGSWCGVCDVNSSRTCWRFISRQQRGFWDCSTHSWPRGLRYKWMECCFDESARTHTHTTVITSARRECLWTFSPLWTVGASCCKTPRLLVNARVRRANFPQPLVV